MLTAIQIRSQSANLFATFLQRRRVSPTRHRRRRRRHRPACREQDRSREGRARLTPFPVIPEAGGRDWPATDRGKTIFINFIKLSSQNSF